MDYHGNGKDNNIVIKTRKKKLNNNINKKEQTK